MQSSALIAGIDLGGTKLAVTIANAQGIIRKQLAPAQTIGANTALAAQAWALIEQACQEVGLNRADISALGISTCSPFVRVKTASGKNAGKTEREVAAPNLCGGMGNNPYALANDWKHFPLESYFTERVPRVAMENDCVAILAAERTFGALRGSDHCVYATWSTGIGFGLCVDGKLLAGKHGNAGHAGHSYVAETDAENNPNICGCGNVGDLEAQTSGKALARQWQVHSQNRSATTQDLFTAATQGDAAALGIIHLAASRFGTALYNLCVTLDSEKIALGGSVFNHHQVLLLPLLQRHTQRGLPALTDGVTLLPAALGEQAGDLGALSLVIPPEWVSGFQF